MAFPVDDRIQEVLVEVPQFLPMGSAAGIKDEFLRRCFARQPVTPVTHVFLIRLDGATEQGLVSLDLYSNDAFVYELWVHPNWRRSGVGRRALALVDVVVGGVGYSRVGLRPVCLDAQISDDSLRRFYTSCGYVQCPLDSQLWWRQLGCEEHLR